MFGKAIAVEARGGAAGFFNITATAASTLTASPHNLIPQHLL